MLENINTSAELKALSKADIPVLAQEIREFLVENVSKTGGHLASNLGVVELTLAIHRVFDLPDDKVVFDVGHQSYVHKILSGRKDFSKLRHEGGISGFPKISESEYDAFGAGHSSTAPSAGLGLSQAAKLCGKDNFTIVVIGDGAATGGLVYEAINNCSSNLKLIVILNENEMSISENVGNMSGVISKIRSTGGYFDAKDKLSRFTESIPFVGKPINSALRKIKRRLKATFYSVEFLEQMGLKYYGPIDGNDYEKVALVLERAKKNGTSAIVHVRTKKGKGYAPAENNPEKYHAVKPMESFKDKSTPDLPTFSQNSGDTLCRLAMENDKICAISAAMKEGTGLSGFFEKFPERAFDVGIAEGHAVTFGAGLAVGGLTPVFAVYSSFLQRSYDNILHDVSLQKLHSVFLIDRAGISPDDGATHHGIWDVAFLSHMENVNLYAPISLEAQSKYIEKCVSEQGINAVRYPKGTQDETLLSKLEYVSQTILSDKTVEELLEAERVVITYGRYAREALEATGNCSENCAVVVCEKLLPYKEVAREISEILSKKVKRIVIAEEGIKCGGFAVNMEHCLRECANHSIKKADYKILAVESVPSHGELSLIFERCGIDAQSILQALNAPLED